MKTQTIIASWAAAALAISAAIAAAQTQGFYSVQVTGTFDYPGAGITAPQKINDQGDIVGFFTDSTGAERGFILASNGTFSPPLIDPNDSDELTEGRGINNAGIVCGDYGMAGRYRGFFLMGNAFTNYDIPRSFWTFVLGVNNAGDFCGATYNGLESQKAFVSIGGTLKYLATPNVPNSYAYQLNDADQVCAITSIRPGVLMVTMPMPTERSTRRLILPALSRPTSSAITAKALLLAATSTAAEILMDSSSFLQAGSWFSIIPVRRLPRSTALMSTTKSSAGIRTATGSTTVSPRF